MHSSDRHDFYKLSSELSNGSSLYLWSSCMSWLCCLLINYLWNKPQRNLSFVSKWRAGCESWTVKKAECWRIDAFELWCWRRLFRVPWTARRSKQSILKEIGPRCYLEGMMLKLKLQYFGHLKRRVDSLEKTLMLGGIGGRRRRGRQRMRWLDGIATRWLWVGDGQGGLTCCNSWGRKESDKTEWLNWTEDDL